MKRYGFLLLSIVIAFIMLANNLVLSSASNSSTLLWGATKKPAAIPTKRPPNVRWVIKQAGYFVFPTPTAEGEAPRLVEAMVNSSEMEGPGVVMITKDSELQVYNFQPSEKITMFQYDLVVDYRWPQMFYEWTLKDWRELITEDDGNLRIKINNTGDTYVVIGEKTGEYNTFSGMVLMRSIVPVAGNQFVGNQPRCKGSAISRLAVGSRALVTTSIRIRQKSAASIGILGRLPAGTYFSITDGPECRDGITWWYGQTATGIEGWVAESDNETYLLEPVQ